MAIELFGFQIGRKEEQKPSVQSFAPPPNDDGSLSVNEGGVFGTTVDLDGTAKNEAALITRYREMSYQPECEKAIDDVINEAIVGDEEDMPVSIILDNIEGLDDQIKDIVRREFDDLLVQLNFHNRAYDIFRNWYVDGRLYYHLMIDRQNPRKGIQEIRYIDPRKIKKVRVEKRKGGQTTQQGDIAAPQYNEYYIYSPKGVSEGNNGVKVAPDAIAYCHSGIMDNMNTMVLSHLQKAIKPLNQLRMLEDATVIYRLARAPERRIFYIDVGNLPKAKAEQYLRDMMVKHKNKLVYDANTGEVRDDRKFLTMLEDYWLPRREGGRGTEISTLPGGQNLGEIEDVLYFRRKLYEALNVPVSRLESDAQFNLGRASEINRDELKFAKFIGRLRNRFSELFHILLERQLLLKGIITQKEWNDIKGLIRYDFIEDNHFSELRDAEVLQNRLQLLQDVDQFVGQYFSKKWIQKNVLYQTEEEIEEIEQEIAGSDDMGGDDEEDFESTEPENKDDNKNVVNISGVQDL
jgi:hypothetical protein